MHLPDYRNGSIVNLMASVRTGLGSEEGIYAPLSELPPDELAQARNVLLMVVDGLGYEYLLGRGETRLGDCDVSAGAMHTGLEDDMVAGLGIRKRLCKRG